jgi:allantoin racemase
MILPVPMTQAALDLFRLQIPDSIRRPDIRLDFTGCRAGATWLDSDYESTLADAFVLEAGACAEDEGYDAVCSFSTSDSAVAALRSRLIIPVVGAAQAAFALAVQLGRRFSVITTWEPWRLDLIKVVARYGLSDRLASVRSLNVPPDTQELLNGKEEILFGELERISREAIQQDGADVIVIGSTTMYQAHEYLAGALPCPVVNPGPAAYKFCENVLDLKLSHSKLAYPAPRVLADHVFRQLDTQGRS